jgi:UDP-glucose 4-epimerase
MTKKQKHLHNREVIRRLKPAVLITGVAGNLGTRLLEQLRDFDVIGADVVRPATDRLAHFLRMDLAEESSCVELMRAIREFRPVAVVHVAFIIDPVRSGVLDVDRMWRINVAGTARVTEAVTETSRDGGPVRKFVHLSSVSAYGSDLPGPVREDFPLGGHTLPYAIHKREADRLVQARAVASPAACATYILRPHIFAGATMDNYLVGAFRGTPNGTGDYARRLRARKRRLPLLLPVGRRYLENRIQFVHIDDVARLIAHLLRREQADPPLTILNVAGRGEPLTFRDCIGISGNRLLRVPTRAAFAGALRLLWKLRVSAIPPEAAPYMTGTYIMDTARLRTFLGAEYERVIHYSNERAFRDIFRHEGAQPARPAGARRSAAS